eukprot:ANDGO_02308.mRNA.1 hypothetical protein
MLATLQMSFRFWKTRTLLVLRQKQAEHLISSTVDSRSLLKAWTKWKLRHSVFLWFSAVLHRSVAESRRRWVLTVAFHYWRETGCYFRMTKDSLTHARAVLLSAQNRWRLQQWKRWTQYCRNLVRLSKRIVLIDNRHRVKNCIQHWKAHHFYLKALQKLRRTCGRQRAVCVLTYFLQLWRRSSIRQVLTSAFLRYWNAHRMGTSFGMWRSQFLASRWRMQCTRLAIAFRSHSVLVRQFKQWKDAQVRKRYFAHATLLIRSRLKRHTFHSMHQAFKAMQHWKKLLPFKLWHWKLQRKQRRSHVLAKAASAVTKLKLSSQFHKWMEFARRERCIWNARVFLKNRHLREMLKYFCYWVHRRRRVLFVSGLERHASLNLMSRFLCRWKHRFFVDRMDLFAEKFYIRLLKNRHMFLWRDSFLKCRFSCLVRMEERRLVSTTFLHWHGRYILLSFTRKCNLYLSRMVHRFVIGHFLAFWRHAAFARQRCAQGSRSLKKTFDRIVLRQTLGALRFHAKGAKHLRRRLIFLKHLEDSFSTAHISWHRALKHWAWQRIAQQYRLRVLERKVRGVRGSGISTAAFSWWKAKFAGAEYRNILCMRCAERSRTRMIRKSFLLWTQSLRDLYSARLFISSLHAVSRAILMRYAVQKWWQSLGDRRRFSSLRMQHSNNTQTYCFLWWRYLACVGEFRQMFLQRRMSLILSKWHGFVVDQTATASKYNSLKRRTSLGQTRLAFRSWLLLFRFRIVRAKLESRLRSSRVLFHTGLLQSVPRFAVLSPTSVLRGCFQMWRVQKFLRKSQRRHCSARLTEWKYKMHMACRIRRLTQRAALLHQSIWFKTWRSRLERHQVLRAMEDEAARFRRHSLLIRSFHHARWYHRTREVLRANFHRVCASLVSSQIQRYFLLVWCIRCAKRRYGRYRILAFASSRNAADCARVVKHAITIWKQKVSVIRLRCKMAEATDRATMTSYFKKWKSTYHHHSDHRMFTTIQQQSKTRLLLRTYFRTWVIAMKAKNWEMYDDHDQDE